MCLVLASCAGTSTRVVDSVLKPVQFAEATIVFENPTDDKVHSDEIMPYFGFIPGSIFGSPTDDFLYVAEPDDDLRIALPIAEWVQEAEQYAAPLSERYYNRGLRTSPSDTRLLRVSTFAYDAAYDKPMGGGFKEEGFDGYIMLIYADKKCTISGNVEADGITFTHNLQIPEKGFYFVGSTDDGYVFLRRLEGELVFAAAN